MINNSFAIASFFWSANFASFLQPLKMELETSYYLIECCANLKIDSFCKHNLMKSTSKRS